MTVFELYTIGFIGFLDSPLPIAQASFLLKISLLHGHILDRNILLKFGELKINESFSEKRLGQMFMLKKYLNFNFSVVS